MLTMIFMLLTMFVACAGPQGEQGEQGVQGEQGLPGKDGKDGVDGNTPTIEISEDGYWIINGVKTEYKATPESVGNTQDYNPQFLSFYPKDDGTYAVSGGNAIMLSEIVIPSSYNGRPVTEIKDNGFKDSFINLKSITIPDTVTSIGNDAFSNCTSLTNINIPNSITSIGDDAFSNCIDLEYNVYDNGCYLGNKNNPYVLLVKAIDKSITNCEINPNTKFIHSSAFDFCRDLKTVTFSNGITSIGRGAFRYCGLTNVLIPDSVTRVGNYAFECCDALTNVLIPDSVTVIGDSAFYSCDSLTSVIIPDSVTSIGSHVFNSCDNLASVIIGSGVTNIGENTFNYCLKLTSVTIPASVTIINKEAFRYCTKLQSINFEGTIAQWNAIEMALDWNYNAGYYTIYCTDGQIAKNGTVTYK